MLRGKRQIAFSPHRFSVDAHIAILVSGITAAGKIRKEAAHDAMCRQGETRAKTFIKNFSQYTARHTSASLPRIMEEIYPSWK